jgi:hypothetical protein
VPSSAQPHALRERERRRSPQPPVRHKDPSSLLLSEPYERRRSLSSERPSHPPPHRSAVFSEFYFPFFLSF